MADQLSENEFNRLLQLKFRLKRRSHHQALAPYELKILAETEARLSACGRAHEYLNRLAHQFGMRVG